MKTSLCFLFVALTLPAIWNSNLHNQSVVETPRGALQTSSLVISQTFNIDSKSTYLHTNQDPNSINASAIDLEALGFVSGDYLKLEQQGAFSYYVGCPSCDPPLPGLPEEATAMIGVFSSSNTLLPSTEQFRVPDAIALNAYSIVTGPTLMGSMPTDIPQDFYVRNGPDPYVVVRIPEGAKYLFVCANDSFYGDNGDANQDFKLKITKITLRQYDAAWGGFIYDHREDQKTIKNRGCALTSLNMALNFAGLDLDPGVLNDLMKQTPGTFGQSGNVVWSATVSKLTLGRLIWRGFTSNSTTVLSNALGQGYPVIVGVNLKSDGTPGHFVLVIAQETIGSTTRFRIIDPGHATRTYLDDPPYQGQFVTRGVVTPANFTFILPSSLQREAVPQSISSDRSSLSVSVNNNVEVMLVDPQNRRTGYNPATQTILGEIPDSAYTRDSLDDDETGMLEFNVNRSISVLKPRLGNYSITVTGIIDGSYQVTVKTYAQNGSERNSLVFTGVTSVGATSTFNFPYTSNVAPFDFDNDGKSDIGVWRPSNGTWFITRSSDSSFYSVPFGQNADKPAPADYDGDGKTDTAVFRPSNGYWYIIDSSTMAFRAQQFGQAGDIPTPGDYDGDGKVDIAVFRPTSGIFYLLYSSDGSFHTQQWGANGDIPVIGDYDKDGQTDFAIFRSASSNFYILRSSDRVVVGQQFGQSGDQPLAADFDGDGMTDITVYRPATGAWYYLQSSDNSFRGVAWGTSGDVPAAGDYDGDGKWDASVFRPSTGTFYILQSTSNALRADRFGLNGDIPIPSAYVQ